uniref:Wall-associated receptor kinase galacturonan-binding domain-containing protein n=1 Tax=Oryza glumipatula TaxID=40148 RepID=A0A0D9Y8G7_9ORYZ
MTHLKTGMLMLPSSSTSPPHLMWSAPTIGQAPGRSLSVRYNNELVIIGCGIEVHMFDTDTDDALGYCSSLCDGIMVMQEEAVGVSCSGMGCCSISFRRTTRAFRFSVIQIEEEAVQIPSLNANAFLSTGYGPYQYYFSMSDLLARDINASTIGASTYLSTRDKKSYACGNYSCYDEPNEGYSCQCSSDSNPYMLDGCKWGINN